REGALSETSHVHARRVHGDGRGPVVLVRAELLRPDYVPTGVVLPRETVVTAAAALAGQRPNREACDVDARRVCRDGGGLIRLVRAELLGPYCVAAGVVFSQEDVLLPGIGAPQRAAGEPGDVHARGIAGDSRGLIERGRAELSRPEKVSIGVVL